MLRLFKKVFVTGGAGYCGSLLVPELLRDGYSVTVYDTFWFGNTLPQLPQLTLVKGDIRDVTQLGDAVRDHDAFVHLACISNDASFELDEALSTSINLDAFEPMVRVAKAAGVRRFIYASSSSVYGVSDQPDVTEDHPLVPLTLYNKYKGMCEPVLKSFCDDNFTGVIFRPATVCGYAPRLRLDLTVNILTHAALTKGCITVFGGSQLRPNLHVRDYVGAVDLFLKAPSQLVRGETFNVGYENMTVADIAQLVKRVVEEEHPDREIEIRTEASADPRSYHINSEKVTRVLGFRPRRTIEDAVRDLCVAFEIGLVANPDDDRYYNIRRMQRLGVS